MMMMMMIKVMLRKNKDEWFLARIYIKWVKVFRMIKFDRSVEKIKFLVLGFSSKTYQVM